MRKGLKKSGSLKAAVPSKPCNKLAHLKRERRNDGRKIESARSRYGSFHITAECNNVADMYMYMYIYVHVHIYTCTCTYMYMYVYVHVRICTCTYMYMYVGESRVD